MKKLSAIMFVTVFLALLGCDGSAGATDGATAKEQGPVGRWERFFRDDIGQNYHETIEFMADGSYVLDASGWKADRGHYVIEDNVLKITSDVDQRHTRNVNFQLDKGTLTLSLTLPFPMEETWERTNRPVFFETVTRAGRAVPKAPTQLLLSAYDAVLEEWRDDAYPTGIRLEEQANGLYEVSLSYFSPSAEEAYTIQVGANDIKTSVAEGIRSPQQPLPTTLMDLDPILDIAAGDGFSGPLQWATLSTYDGYGAVWRFHTGARTAASYSAADGSRIAQDVTGYIAQYNADWAAVGKLWREAMARNAPAEKNSLFSDSFRRGLKNSKSSCEASGGSWTNSTSTTGGRCQ